ncbi:uncharacterized protein L203_104490 [Cryptococcus depauperatus CBS 7841]|uniref:Uncharacterized protein n=1 Tax=Cryptococcus depauperatus CBS 7841 TaxID=1295531 RepID=A0AAJ8JVT8_9TREE
MPEKKKKSSGDGERSSKPSENTQRSSSSRHRSSNPSENGQRKTSSKSGSGNRLTQARETGQSVSQNVENAYNTAMGWLGCERDLNRQIQRYNPIFYEFAEKNLLPSYDIQYKASSFIPIFHWPLGLLAKYLQFIFLYETGMKELQRGFASSQRSNRVKSLITALVIISALQLIPTFLLDTYYHFGALWDIFLPAVLFITPWKEQPEQTIAATLCDSCFGFISESVGMLIPEAVTGENGHTTTMIIAGVTIMLFYVGSVGSLAVYVAVWAYLSISTITMLGRRLVKKEESSSQHYKQMTNWHNTMAIWLWRFIISAMEGIHIPGIISAMDLILHYIPTYFLNAVVESVFGTEQCITSHLIRS